MFNFIRNIFNSSKIDDSYAQLLAKVHEIQEFLNHPIRKKEQILNILADMEDILKEKMK